MKINPIGKNFNTVNFDGRVKVKTYNDEGKANIEVFQTSRHQDQLVKLVANATSENGMLANKISDQSANNFAKLIESIIGKKLKKTNQEKLMTNGYKDYVSYGDRYPAKGGVYLEYYFDKGNLNNIRCKDKLEY